MELEKHIQVEDILKGYPMKPHNTVGLKMFDLAWKYLLCRYDLLTVFISLLVMIVVDEIDIVTIAKQIKIIKIYFQLEQSKPGHDVNWLDWFSNVYYICYHISLWKLAKLSFKHCYILSVLIKQNSKN